MGFFCLFGNESHEKQLTNMNTLRRLTSVLVFLFLLTGTTYAQLNYSFVQSTSAYVPLTGATVLGTASSTSGATALDNVIYNLPAGTIPFTFYFNGAAYSSCFVTTNGYLTFGVAPSGTNSNPISSTATYTGVISVFGRDMLGSYRVTTPGDGDTIAQLRYAVVGVAPNREFVIEWANFRPSGAATNPNMNMQIRLAEGSNNIKLHYGLCDGTFNSSTCQIGLRGATNAAFQNRALTSGQPFANSTAGTLNTSSVAYTTATVPVNGQVLTFVSPCPPPVSLGLVDALPTTVKLRWSSGIPSGSYPGASYSVEWGANGFTPGTGTIVNTSDTFLLLNSLTTGAQYQYYVSRNCAPTGNGLSTAAGPKNFTTGGSTEDCTNALQISIGPDSLSTVPVLVSSGISQNGPNALCSDAQGGNTPDDDRWYKFVAPASNKRIRISTGAGTVNDWVMEVWSSCPGGSGNVLKCADDTYGGMPSIELCQNEYTAGQTYYIRVWTYSQTASGTMNLYLFEDGQCPIPPSYDACETAIQIPVNPVLYCPGSEMVFTTQFATHSGLGGANGQAPSCDPNTTINDVWLSFNTGTTGTFNLTFTKLSATDLRAQLLFECGAGGIEVQCFNPANGTYTISGLNPQANYVLRIWSPVGQSGTFSVCASDACDDATATISGYSTICTTGVAQIRFDMTGQAPWNVTYSDGISNYNFSTSTTPYFVNVSPTVSTFYSLVSVLSPICSGSVNGNASVTVVPPPTVTLAPFTTSVCSNTISTLTGGNPVGGAYSGTGVSGSQFNASIAGVGTHTITYTYGVGNGCQRSASQPITVISGPVISSFAPAVAPVGSTITITGTGFTGVNQVKFNTVNAVTFTVVNSTTITAVVPVGATTGYIFVTKSNSCNAQSLTTFGVGTPPGTNLTVKAYIEGFYYGGGQMAAVVDPFLLPNKCDTVTIELHQAVSPYGMVVTRTGLMNTDGTITVSIPAAQVGNSYYLVIKGRNFIETWSKNPELMVSGNMTFDFTPDTGSGILRTTGSATNGVGSQGLMEMVVPEKPEHPE